MHHLKQALALLALLFCLACGEAAPTVTPAPNPTVTSAPPPATPTNPPATAPATVTLASTPIPTGPTTVTLAPATSPTAPATVTLAPTAVPTVPPTPTTPPATPTEIMPTGTAATPTVENTPSDDTGAPVKLYAGKQTAYVLEYPASWGVVREAPADATAPLPEVAQFAAPGAGAAVFSAPTAVDGATLVDKFLAHPPAIPEPLQDVQPQTTSGRINPGGSVEERTFSANTAHGPLTGKVTLTQFSGGKKAASYLVYTYAYPAAGESVGATNAVTLFPFPPLETYKVPPEATIGVAGLGGIHCPQDWAGTADPATRQLNCNNQVRGSMGNADITVTLTDTVDPQDAAAAYEAQYDNLPVARVDLASDFFVYVLHSGLVGPRVEYLRVLPVGGNPARAVRIVANGAPEEVIPAILSFRPATAAMEMNKLSSFAPGGKDRYE